MQLGDAVNAYKYAASKPETEPARAQQLLEVSAAKPPLLS
jgi:hypothetical protein